MENLSVNRFGLRAHHLLLLACGVLYVAQSFTPWSWPAIDGYPAIERWLDPGFLPGDFYTNTTDKYGVDTIQAWFLGGIQQATGIHYDVTLAVMTALRMLAFPWVLYLFFKAFTGDRLAAILAVVIGALSNFSLPKTLGWAWLWGDPSTAMFAVFCVTLGWAFFLRRQAWPMLLLMALAALLQPLVAVHGGIMVAAIYLFDYSNAEKRSVLLKPTTILAALVFLACFGSQYVLLAAPGPSRLPSAEYVRILVWERHPTDFLVSRFGEEGMIAFALALAACAVMLARVWGEVQRRTLLLGALGVYGLICLTGWYFVEVRPLRLMADLIPFRTVIIGAPMFVAIIALFAAQMLRGRRYLVLAALTATALAAGHYAVQHQVSPIIPGAMLLGVALLGWLPAPSREPRELPELAWLGVAVLVGLLALPAAWQRRHTMVLPTVENQHPLYLWAREHTPPASTFLIEQTPSRWIYGNSISPQLMRLRGRRAVAASLDYPFADSDLRAWLKTWAVGLGHGAKDYIETASPARLAQICAALPYDYVVRETPLPAGSGFTPVQTFAPARGLQTLTVYQGCRSAR